MGSGCLSSSLLTGFIVRSVVNCGKRPRFCFNSFFVIEISLNFLRKYHVSKKFFLSLGIIFIAKIFAKKLIVRLNG